MAPHLPTISIVTPVLNGNATLRQTIVSVLEQDYPHLQYIIVEGGSTDGSLQTIREFGKRISLLIQGTDQTLYDAIVKGFARATGDIFGWLNSDDLYMPGALLRVGAAFTQHPDWEVVHGDDAAWKQGWLLANKLQGPVGLRELMSGHVLPQASTFFTQRAYARVGGLERVKLKLAADYQLWLRLAAVYPFHFIPAQLSIFRIRHGQLSGDWSAYAREMEWVAQGAAPYLPAGELPAAPRRARLRWHYPLADHTVNWAPVQESRRQPLTDCRCPSCGEYPQRLLFSAPDPRGGAHVTGVYLCETCETAFAFPPLTPDAPEINSADNWWRRDTELPAGVYSPFRRGPVLGQSMLEMLAGRVMENEVEPATGLQLNDDEIAMPNLDSIYLHRLGACWGGWDTRLVPMAMTLKGLRKHAAQRGLSIAHYRTVTPAAGLYRGEQLARWGLAAHVSAWPAPDDPTWQKALRAAAAARMLHDWRGRGDLFVATLEKR